MATVPTKIKDRIVSGVKRFQPVLAAAKSRDAGESDTSTLVKDILADVFGYDKYTEITSEHAIKGTYCDLAIKLDGKLNLLIEVKAIGLDLKDAHVKQAIDYAANQGVEWVVLTNGITWRIYRVMFTQPIGQDLVFECDLTSVNVRDASQIECLFLFAKEGHGKSVLQDYHAQRVAMGRHYLAAVILSDNVLDVIRRELRRLSPDVRIDREQLKTELIAEVLKREVTEGDKALEARKKISKMQAKLERARTSKAGVEDDIPVERDMPIAKAATEEG